MEDFYPQAIYHGVNYFPVIDTSQISDINGKNFYKVLQLNKGKLKEVSVGRDIEDLAKDFSLKQKQGSIPKGNILNYLTENNDIKNPLIYKIKEYPINSESGKITSLSSEEYHLFKEKYFSLVK